MSALAEAIGQPDLLRHQASRVDALVSEPPPADDPGRRAWFAELEDAVLDLSVALPEGVEDYDARKLLEFLVVLRRALEGEQGGGERAGAARARERSGGPSGPPEAAVDDAVELAAMSVRDVVRRIARRLEHDELDDPRVAADAIFSTLRGVGAGDLARLLGVSTKTVGAWRAGRPVTRNAGRVVLVAQLLTYLRASMTPAGLVMWFDAPREQLGGRTPLQVLDAGAAAAREPLNVLARGTRGQLAG